MLFWIIAALILHAAYAFTPTLLYLPREGFMNHMGGRDNLPEPSVLTARARRALANWQESLPVFLTLAILALILPDVEDYAVTGAAIFVIARAAYLPFYVFVPMGLRSTAWGVAIFGLVMMAWALI